MVVEYFVVLYDLVDVVVVGGDGVGIEWSEVGEIVMVVELCGELVVEDVEVFVFEVC